MISRKLLVVTLTTLLLTSCIKSPLIDRTYYNYFPFEVGKSWTYLLNDTDTVTISIVGDTLLGEDTMLIFENYDGTRTYLFSTSSAFYSLEDTSIVGPNGEDIKLEDRIFILLYEKPFVVGNAWDDFYSNVVPVGEDTFWINHSRTGEVLGLGDVETPAGSFENVYSIRILDSREIGGPDGIGHVFTIKDVYFAPDIGMVKELISVNVKDSSSSGVTDTTFTTKLELLR